MNEKKTNRMKHEKNGESTTETGSRRTTFNRKGISFKKKRVQLIVQKKYIYETLTRFKKVS